MAIVKSTKEIWTTSDGKEHDSEGAAQVHDERMKLELAVGKFYYDGMTIPELLDGLLTSPSIYVRLLGD